MALFATNNGREAVKVQWIGGNDPWPWCVLEAHDFVSFLAIKNPLNGGFGFIKKRLLPLSGKRLQLLFYFVLLQPCGWQVLGGHGHCVDAVAQLAQVGVDAGKVLAADQHFSGGRFGCGAWSLRFLQWLHEHHPVRQALAACGVAE